MPHALKAIFIEENNKILKQLSEEEATWHFIPPRGPHFGKLWEVSVKSDKRVAGNAFLKIEEFETLIVQIEAILNSRPLSPISSDPSDLNPLRPFHYLIGDTSRAIPEENLEDTPINPLTRWQYVQKLRQQFWRQWHKEYLTNLQYRTKWKDTNTKIQPGQLVLLRENNIPPMNWPLGRIIATHLGKDNVVLVVTVKSQYGTFKRTVVKICGLPIEDNFCVEDVPSR